MKLGLICLLKCKSKAFIRKIDGQAEAVRFYNYPFEALEEAISNAVYHKSYQRDNSIEINIRPDCIEILSFPGSIPPVDNEMLKKKRVIARDYRNSRIGDYFKELQLTEGRGTGIPKIRHFMNSNNSPLPIFETDEDKNYFLTTLNIHPDFPRVTDMVTDNLTENQIKIINFIQETPTLTTNELSSLVRISQRKIKENISKLKDKDILVRIGSAKGGHWKVIKVSD